MHLTIGPFSLFAHTSITPYGFGVTIGDTFALEVSTADFRLRLPFIGEAFTDYGEPLSWEPWRELTHKCARPLAEHVAKPVQHMVD